MRAGLRIILLMLVVFPGLLCATTTVNEQSHDVAADFTLLDTDETIHSLSDYKGQWVIVNFWATWCGPCIREIPELERFYQQHQQKGVTVIGINFEELTVEQLRQAIGEFGISYPVLRIGSVPLVPFEPLKGLPSTFVVSPQGRMVKSWVGPVNEEVLNTYIRTKLDEGKSVSADSIVRR